MKIKLIYFILILLLLVGNRIYHEVRSTYHFMNDNDYKEIQHRLNIDTGIVCILIPHKTYYRIGESPQVDILIINRTDSIIYLPGCLDGSSLDLRLPSADIKILNKNNRKNKTFCPMFNPLVNNQMKRLAPDEFFKPFNNWWLKKNTIFADSLILKETYSITELDGFWTPNGLDRDNYIIPGNYDIQFVYSTKKDSTYLFGWLPDIDFNMNLLDSVPEVELFSNIVTLKYRFY